MERAGENNVACEKVTSLFEHGEWCDIGKSEIGIFERAKVCDFNGSQNL